MQWRQDFLAKVVPYFKIGHKKCPFSILATDFWKKKRNLSTTREGNFFELFFQKSLQLCSEIAPFFLLYGGRIRTTINIFL